MRRPRCGGRRCGGQGGPAPAPAPMRGERSVLSLAPAKRSSALLPGAALLSPWRRRGAHPGERRLSGAGLRALRSKILRAERRNGRRAGRAALHARRSRRRRRQGSDEGDPRLPRPGARREAAAAGHGRTDRPGARRLRAHPRRALCQRLLRRHDRRSRSTAQPVETLRPDIDLPDPVGGDASPSIPARSSISARSACSGCRPSR